MEVVKFCPFEKPGCSGCPVIACPYRVKHKKWEPTREEITAACEDIQRGWSKKTFNKRKYCKPFTVPVVSGGRIDGTTNRNRSRSE